MFRRQNQQQQQQQFTNNSQYDPLDFVVIDKPLNVSYTSPPTTATSMIASSIPNRSSIDEQQSKFPNVQSYTEQGNNDGILMIIIY